MTREEKKLRNKYLNIRGVGVVTQLSGILAVITSPLLIVSILGKGDYKTSLGFLIYLIVLIPVGIYLWHLGHSLRQYRAWSYWGSIITYIIIGIFEITTRRIAPAAFSALFIWAVVYAKDIFQTSG